MHSKTSVLRRSETLQSPLRQYKHTQSQLADISSGRFCLIEGGVSGQSIGSGLPTSCALFALASNTAQGKDLTSTCVTTSVACESCCESTAATSDARSSVLLDSAISTSCDSEVSGSVAQTASDGAVLPLLRARFAVFSGAGTAGRPNNVDCFVLSLLDPRPFAALVVATIPHSISTEAYFESTYLSTCPFPQPRPCQRNSRSCVGTCCSDCFARTDCVSRPPRHWAFSRMDLHL